MSGTPRLKLKVSAIFTEVNGWVWFYTVYSPDYKPNHQTVISGTRVTGLRTLEEGLYQLWNQSRIADARRRLHGSNAAAI